MKRLTLAMAVVMLPYLGFSYQVVSLGLKKMKLSNRSDGTQFMRINIPPNALRVVYHISIDNNKPASPIGLYKQVEDILTGPAADYLVPHMVTARPSKSPVDFCVFDSQACVDMFYRGDPSQCEPSERYRKTNGGMFQKPWLPGNYGQYYLCFTNPYNEGDCFVTVEAVAIVQ